MSRTACHKAQIRDSRGEVDIYIKLCAGKRKMIFDKSDKFIRRAENAF